MTRDQRRALAMAGISGALFAGLLIALRVGVVEGFDRYGHEALHRFGTANDAWLAAMRAVTHLGDSVTVFAVDTALVVVCLLARRRAALFLAVTGVAVWGIRIGVRALIARSRPDDPFWPADGAAFPSGHATNSAAMVAIAVIVGWPWLRSAAARTIAVGAAVLLAGAVGLSRVAGGMHWPTDVIGGWLLAATLVALSVSAFHLLWPLWNVLDLTIAPGRRLPDRPR